VSRPSRSQWLVLNLFRKQAPSPSEVARIPGEAVVIDTLVPGKTVQTIRKGYGHQELYDGLGEFPVALEYRRDGRSYLADDRRWTRAIVALPNARRA
jgi:hypothetical protein